VLLIAYFAILGWGILGALLFIAFTSSWPEHQNKKTSRAHDPTEDELAKPSAVASILHRFVKHKESDSEKREAFEGSQHRWAKWTTVGVWLYTLITFAIFVASLIANRISNENLVNANRAWLAPTTFLFVKSVDDPDGPVVEVHYQNVGRLPALDVNASGGIPAGRLTARTAPGWNTFPTPVDGWNVVETNMRNGCEAREPLTDRMALFPSAATDDKMELGINDIPSSKAEHQNVIDGTSMYLVVGCLVYRTFDETRRTGFCRYISKHRTGAWEIINCPTGNFAY